MSVAVVASLVALGISIIVNLISIGIFVGQMKAFREMADFRFNRLETKQDKYNHLQERTGCNERDIKTAFRLIELYHGSHDGHNG